MYTSQKELQCSYYNLFCVMSLHYAIIKCCYIDYCTNISTQNTQPHTKQTPILFFCERRPYTASPKELHD